MPRDGSGNYALPVGYFVASGDTVLPSQHNPALEDVATALTGSVPINGSKAMTGLLTLFGDPTSALHAATKQYVDTTTLRGLKVVCKAATTANITLSGAQTIDGVSVVAGDRVLVKNQTTASQNGIYVAASGAWSRAADMDSWTEVPTSLVAIEQGTVNADTLWLCTSNTGGTIGTTAINWLLVGPYVLQPSAGPITFRATKSGNQSITQAVETKVTFTTEVFDTAGIYDSTNSQVTPPAGWINLRAQVLHTTTAAAGDSMQAIIRKNGVAIRSMSFAQAGNNNNALLCEALDLANGTDIYDVTAIISGSSARTIGSSALTCWFEGWML